MSDCCSSSKSENQAPKKYTCPVNGKKYSQVSFATVAHHIQEPWNLKNTEQAYYFCEDPECNVVYFGQDNSIIEQDALRTIVGIKQKSNESLVCYCFGVNRQEAASNPEAKAFVIENTKNHTCVCEVRNPSGKCCLKDFPKYE